MQKIIPLKYKIKLWKNILWVEKTAQYSNPDYLKKRLEEEFKLSEHLSDPDKIFLKKHSSRYVSLEESIETTNKYDTDFIFIKFKYWDKVAENDNWKIVEEWKIIQIIENRWTLLTDFYFWMEFKIKPDTKYLIIEWTITTVQKSNEQMKAQILNLFSTDIYIQEEHNECKPEYTLEFKFEEEELERVKERVKWLELITTIKPESRLDQAESWNIEKSIPLKISIGWGVQDEIFSVIKNTLDGLPWIQSITKRAVIKQWKSIVRSNFSSDWLILSLKDSFLYSHDNIGYNKFKQETFKYIVPWVDFTE